MTNTTNILTGTEAIEYAEACDLTLNKYNDPTEGAREGLSVDEARDIAAEDASLVWVATRHTYTLNDAGKQALREEIRRVGKDTIIPSAFFEGAENAACDWDMGNDAVIEVGQHYSHDGRPHVISLSRDWFDAERVEA